MAPSKTFLVLLFAVFTLPREAAHDENFQVLLTSDADAAAADAAAAESFRKKAALVDLALDSTVPDLLLDAAAEDHQNGSLVEVTGRRIAFITAIEYTENLGVGVSSLQTIPDAYMVYTKLRSKGFRNADITIVTDGRPSDYNLEFPRKVNLIQLHRMNTKTATHLWSLLRAASSQLQAGDFFVLHFSGHGVQVPNVDGQELDGKDEAFVAASYPNDGLIRDNDIYQWLVGIPGGVTVTMVADACHSEGLSDLPFNYNPGRVGKSLHWKDGRFWCTDWVNAQALPMATVRYFSGSQNTQTSIGNAKGGAFTHQLFKAWSENDKRNSGTMYDRFKQLLIDFKLGQDTIVGGMVAQEPNICAFPTFRDSGDFTMWNNNLNHDDARGGKRPGASSKLRAPPRCTHDRGRVDGGESGFSFDERLAQASSPTGLTEGWTSPLLHKRVDAMRPQPKPEQPQPETPEGCGPEALEHCAKTGESCRQVDPTHFACEQMAPQNPAGACDDWGIQYCAQSGKSCELSSNFFTRCGKDDDGGMQLNSGDKRLYNSQTCCTVADPRYSGGSLVLLSCASSTPNELPKLFAVLPSGVGAEC